MASKGYIAFDIGAENIKIADAVYEKGKIVVNDFWIIPTPPNSFENGNILKPDLIAEAVSQKVDIRRLKAKGAVVLVTGDSVIDREVVLPKMTEKELKNVIMFEADQYFPVDLTTYKVDYKIIEEISDEDGKKYRVFIVAVPIDILDGYINLMNEFGMKIEVMDIPANALAKFVTLEAGLSSPENNSSLAVIDLGASTSRVIMIDGGKFRFERMIKFGINDLTEVMMQHSNLKFKDAEEQVRTRLEQYVVFKAEDVLLEDESKMAAHEISKLINDFTGQVNKLFEFYISRNTGNVINRLLLTGGGARVKGMGKFISDSTGIRTDYLEPLTCIMNKSRKSLEENEIYLANVLGAVIRTKK